MMCAENKTCVLDSLHSESAFSSSLLPLPQTIFVTSAGNSGPALTTVGAPAAAAGPLFVIGAWVSESMQQAEYALLDTVKSSVYTWCSRGPLFNGGTGITCYAPGAAITSVPLYGLKCVSSYAAQKLFRS